MTLPCTRLLDLTRLVSRAGGVMTGIDRVEYAYLRALLQEPDPLFGLVRTSVGYILLDRSGCAFLKEQIDCNHWGVPDWIGRLRRLPRAQAGLEAQLRRASQARCLRKNLPHMLHCALPPRTHYLNVGHSNLTSQVIAAVRNISNAHIGVMIHDTIPLDFPQYQRPETMDRFRGFLSRATQNADVLICVSENTRQAISRHISVFPHCIVAHLGIDPLHPGLAPTGPWNAPYFISIGTIEPRKNHALLLDIWPEIPDAHLIICGNRGWGNHNVFATLDEKPERIHEVGNLGDEEMLGLLKGSLGLLFPSHAEGFGLPPVEAAALGVTVLSNDLAVLREILNDIPVYLPVLDRYKWITEIKRRVLAYHAETPARPTLYAPPGWEAHFKQVLMHI